MDKNERKLSEQKVIYDVSTWVNIQVNHLSYTRNLIIVLALAILGFLAHQIINGNFWYDQYKLCIHISLILNILTILLGIVISLLTEWNFRLYRKISRIFVKADSYESVREEVTNIQCTTTTIEKLNKFLFFSQLSLFGIGVLFVAFALW